MLTEWRYSAAYLYGGLSRFLFVISPLKTMKNVFYFIQKALLVLEIFKFLYSRLPPFFLPVSHCFSGCLKINLQVYDIINCLNKNLITHFVWYLEREERYDIEILSIDRVLNKEHFYGKVMQKICRKSSS